MKSRTRSRARTPRAVIAAVAALATLSACSGSGSGGGDGGGEGGALAMAIPADEGCIDPQQLVGRSQLTVARSMVDSLVFQNDAEFEPWLATEWQVSDDATTYTFTLRDDVTFSDGGELTGQTVVDNFEAILEMGSKARLASTYLAGMQSATAPDDRTVEIVFEQPNAAFLAAVATPSMGIVSDESAATDQAARCQGEFSGSGAFVLDDYTPNQSISLAKRDDYGWGPLREGAAYLDTVEVSIAAESSVRTGMLVGGQADYITEVQRADLETLAGSDLPVESQSNPGVSQGLFVNPTRGPLRDPAVRQALLLGVDRQTLIDTTLTEYQKIATSVLSSATPGYVDHSDLVRFDADEAAETLQDAGWIEGADGIREKDGERLTVSLLYGSQLYGFLVPLMELLQQQYAEVGIELKLRPMPDAEANTAEVNHDYDLRISAMTRAEPDVMRTAFIGTDEAVDALLAEQVSLADTEQRLELVDEAQRRILEDGLFVPINELALPMAHSRELSNVQYSTDSLVLLGELRLAG
ncbi:ABC transporter substrate-binding protein [Leucobacter allii]|uniref:ABC transporter substrate-binding protein n=1 Tax=Leucobacter allii TaxID=2932247 RepID=UPI001FD25969|nr:ABC transporter substrate-binding protein [Leucobacter allii]UOR01536.1 ABC transporter substrate-binding protein [Leucobacter allii]